MIIDSLIREWGTVLCFHVPSTLPSYVERDLLINKPIISIVARKVFDLDENSLTRIGIIDERRGFVPTLANLTLHRQPVDAIYTDFECSTPSNGPSF